MKHIRKFNEGIKFAGPTDEGVIGKKIWGSDIGDEIREIFQEFYDLIYERFTEVRFSPTGNRIAIQFAYNSIFNNVPIDKVGEVMIKTWTELDLAIKKFQNLCSCKLVHIETSSDEEIYSINWQVRLFFDKII